MQMKPLPVLCALALMLGACADPLEQRTTQEVGAQLQRGVSGQGKLVPSESVNNPTGAPSASETPPDYPPPP